MELLALEVALFRCFVLHPPNYGTPRLRMGFSTGFGNTKTSTLGVVPMRTVTNFGPRDH